MMICACSKSTQCNKVAAEVTLRLSNHLAWTCTRFKGLTFISPCLSSTPHLRLLTFMFPFDVPPSIIVKNYAKTKLLERRTPVAISWSVIIKKQFRQWTDKSAKITDSMRALFIDFLIRLSSIIQLVEIVTRLKLSLGVVHVLVLS